MPPVNPYRNRKPITEPSQFYGRRNDILSLAEKISYGQMCAISGEPLIGKTSFLYYLIHPQGARSLPEFVRCLGNPDAYLFVLIEPGRLPMRNAHGVLRYLFDRVIEEAERSHVQDGATPCFPNYAQRQDDYEIQRSFEHYIKNLKKRVVLLFDDFDIVVKELTKSDAGQVMQQLRALAQGLDLEGRLNCIFTSLDPLEQVLKANDFTSDSPLSRIITDYMSLRPLDEEEIEQYINGPLQDTPFPEPEVDFIKHFAGRHPGIVKITCSHMFGARYQKKKPAAIQATQETIEKDPGMLWLMDTLWQRIEQAEIQEGLPLKDGMIRLAQGPLFKNKEDTIIFERLHRRGLIDLSARDPWILGNFFRNFIQRKNAEVHSIQHWNEPNFKEAQEILTPLESRLYRYLVENSERTCGREELQRAVWGDKLPTSRDALEQLIKRVREKIEPHPEYPEYLLTVRGLGYLLRGRRRS